MGGERRPETPADRQQNRCGIPYPVTAMSHRLLALLTFPPGTPQRNRWKSLRSATLSLNAGVWATGVIAVRTPAKGATALSMLRSQLSAKPNAHFHDTPSSHSCLVTL